jgi:hypothetical protein
VKFGLVMQFLTASLVLRRISTTLIDDVRPTTRE